MKKQVITAILAAGLLGLGGCNQDEIDALKGQVTELTDELAKTKEEQQAELERQIEALQQTITALTQDKNDLVDDKDALEAALEQLSELVDANKADVYYGHVVTAEDYDKVLQSGASIITGRVIVSDASLVEKLAGVAFVGGDLEIRTNGELLTLPTNVAGDVIIGGNVDGAVNVGGVEIVGGNFKVMNTSIQSVTADDIALVTSDVLVNQNKMKISTLSLAGLQEVVGSVMISNHDTDSGQGNSGSTPDDTRYSDASHRRSQFGGTMPGRGVLGVDFSGAHIKGDAYFEFMMGDIAVGDVDGDVYIEDNMSSQISLNGSKIGGNLSVSYNFGGGLALDGTIAEVGGDVMIEKNYAKIGFSAFTFAGLSSIALDALTTVGGNLIVQNNNAAALTDLVAFNELTEVGGRNVTFKNNGGNEVWIDSDGNGTDDTKVFTLETMDVLNKLTDATYRYGLTLSIQETVGDVTIGNSYVDGSTNLSLSLNLTKSANADTQNIDAFNKLTGAKGLTLTLDGATGLTAFTDFTAVEGSSTVTIKNMDTFALFDNVTTLKYGINLTISSVNTVNAFAGVVNTSNMGIKLSDIQSATLFSGMTEGPAYRTLSVQVDSEIPTLNVFGSLTSAANVALKVSNVATAPEIMSNLTSVNNATITATDVTTVGSFNSITSSTGTLSITATNVETVNTFNNLTEAKGLTLNLNNAGTVSAFAGLTEVSGNLLVTARNMSTVNFFNEITSAVNVTLNLERGDEATPIQSVNAYNGLNSVTGNITLKVLGVEDVTVLSNVTETAGNVSLTVEDITTANYFSNFTAARDAIVKAKNVQTVNTLNNLTTAEDITLEFNNVATVNVLNAATEATGSVSLTANAVPSFTALSALEGINGTYKRVTIKTDYTVDMCSMSTFLTNVLNNNAGVHSYTTSYVKLYGSSGSQIMPTGEEVFDASFVKTNFFDMMAGTCDIAIEETPAP